ncbi:MAG: VWA domain-containing protein [Bryobacterales bacterium]|nr:VWA domain-containing protein [Acidobacteriota bacterium]MCB9385474.1 VWA domain-containing protein [Bryobacterales bacterium]
MVSAVLLGAALVFAQDAKVDQQAGPNDVVPASEETTIRVQVSRVPLLFTVTDKKNRFITNLEKEDFEVFDNGEKQEIRQFVRESDLPLRIGIVMDTSNSVRDRFRFEQEAAIEFIRGVLAVQKDRAFLVSYDTRAELMVDFTADPEELAVGVRGMRPGGGTALYDAIYYACRDKLPEDRPLEQFRRALVVIGDGEDNQSSVTRDMALEMAHKAEVVVYTISTNRSGQRQDGDKVLKYLAEETGGISFFPFQARDLEQSFADIANELRHQYFIIYSPTNFDLDGSFHKIRLKTTVKNAQVRVRSGYYAPLPEDPR